MRILTIIILAALILLALFAAFNWGVLTAPADVSIFGFRTQASPGLIVLGFALTFAVLALAYVAAQRTVMLMELRRASQQLEAQRDLAERAEASRLNDLRQELEREFARLRTTMEESTNSLAASISEIDEKLDRPDRPGTSIDKPRV
jgi:uncharacterized integral membrane protein